MIFYVFTNSYAGLIWVDLYILYLLFFKVQYWEFVIQVYILIKVFIFICYFLACGWLFVTIFSFYSKQLNHDIFHFNRMSTLWYPHVLSVITFTVNIWYLSICDILLLLSSLSSLLFVIRSHFAFSCCCALVNITFLFITCFLYKMSITYRYMHISNICLFMCTG